MLSKPLMKHTLKENIKFWAIITGILSLMLIVLFSIASGSGDNNAMILGQFYTMFASLLPLIFIVTRSNRLMAAQVDNGSMAFLMSTPIKRKTVLTTYAIFIIGSVFAMYLVLTIVGLIVLLIAGSFIEIGAFFLLNLGSMLLNLAISGIAYFASCFFNTSRQSFAVGTGAPVAFLVIRMLAEVTQFVDIEGLDMIKYLSLNSLFSISDIMAYSVNIIWQFFILIAITAIGYVIGMFFFKRKDLPL